MAFFGLTYLGPPNPFSTHIQTKSISQLSDASFAAAFDDQVAKNLQALQNKKRLNIFEQLQKEQKDTIGIDDIRVLLSSLFNDLPPPEHLVALLTKHCDLLIRGPQRAGQGAETGILVRIPKDRFMQAVAIVRDIQEEDDDRKNRKDVNSIVASEYTSYNLYTSTKHKHQRSLYAPQQKFTVPVTTAQQVGWYNPSKVEQVDRTPNVSCEETRFAGEMVKSGIYF